MTVPRTFRTSLLLALVALLATLSLVQGIRNAWQQPNDLRMRYQTARLMLAGENPHRIKATGEMSTRARGILEGNLDDFAPDYLPSAMLAMLPLALLPWEPAKLAWLGINLVSAAGLVVLLRRWPGTPAISGHGFLIAVCLWIAGTPFRNNLGLGQNCVFALALTLAAVFCQERKQILLAGLLLSLGLFKYAYVWPLVLFFFVLNRGWKTLLVAGVIHGAAHLLLCLRMGAHPAGIIAEVLQDNAHVFNRDTTLTVWLPFRTLAGQFPQLHLAANLLGAITLGAMVLGLIYLWERNHSSRELTAWIFLLGLLSTLAVTSRGYHLSYCLAGWLWFFTAPRSRATRVPRWVMAGGLLYLTLVHRFIEALSHWRHWDAEQWLLRAFNVGLFLMCVASLILFLRTRRENALPTDPNAALPGW